MLDQANKRTSVGPDDPAEDTCCGTPADQAACLPAAELPIACTLSEAELRERRRTLLESTRKGAIEIVELPSGYAYLFEPASEMLLDLCRLIDMERECCPFLTFTLIVGAGGQPIRLEITGAPQAQPVIAGFFGS